MMKFSVEPPPALLLSFADEPNADFVLNLPLQKLALEDVSVCLDTMQQRVNSRCKGLIEVVGSNSKSHQEVQRMPVHYLHKTVKDYIKSPNIQKKLLGRMHSTLTLI